MNPPKPVKDSGKEMKCKNCRYWGNLKGEEGRLSEYYSPTDPDTFEPMASEFKVKHCTNPKLLFCERPLDKNGFSVVDGSNYFASLITAEDFGCVLFEADNGGPEVK